MADVDIRILEAEQTSWKQTAKDLGSGAAGGIAQVLIGEFFRLSFPAVCEGDTWNEEKASGQSISSGLTRAAVVLIESRGILRGPGEEFLYLSDCL